VGPNWVTAAFRQLLASSDLPRLHVHSLRHSWATAALESGENLCDVADIMGHADTSVTDRTHVHTVRKVQDAAALRVAALIGSKRAARRLRWPKWGRGAEYKTPANALVGVARFELATPSPPD